MQVTTEGIVLKQRKIANNRRMIVIFTQQYGKISAGTSINERNKSRAALALRPFTFSEYELFKGREVFNINSATAKKSYFAIGEDLDKFMTASAFINYLDKVLEDNVPMPGLFRLALEFMESVSEATADPRTLLYAFIVRSLRILGVMPEMDCCVNCGKIIPERIKLFSVTSGGIICEDCANHEKTDGNALIYKPSFDIIDVFRYFLSKPLKTFEKITLKPGVSEMVRNILAEYTDFYLGADVLSDLGVMEV